mmetsp:Transcript_123236/g.239675  ORF Transcript_123236/g.239675 Transcript_123236/m.239675 type:complete len:150 (+) Transcript_123236:82-531(+)
MILLCNTHSLLYPHDLATKITTAKPHLLGDKTQIHKKDRCPVSATPSRWQQRHRMSFRIATWLRFNAVPQGSLSRLSKVLARHQLNFRMLPNRSDWTSPETCATPCMSHGVAENQAQLSEETLLGICQWSLKSTQGGSPHTELDTPSTT